MNVDDKKKENIKRKAEILDEVKIQKTIEASKERFLLVEGAKTLSYHSFFYIQFKLIQKKWWFFQICILVTLWSILLLIDDVLYAYRSMGVGATLFIILIIPELWKNRTNQCMEIESTTYYSLRQVYAARMMIFGIIDILFLTVFCGITSISIKISLVELLVQFIFPVMITACICFGVLGSRYCFSEMVAIVMCIVWSTVWWCIILDDFIYDIIAIPIWIMLLGIAVLFLSFMVYRSLYQCEKIWEGNLYGTEND